MTGVRWRVVPSPNLAGHDSLWSVAAVSARDVWAVGLSDRGQKGQTSLVEHWDGVRWRIVPS
jgi:hypothetical protein